MVVVSIIGCNRFTTGYNAAKVAHERAVLSGPIPVRLLRAAQFHEFVAQLVEWGQVGRGQLPAEDVHTARGRQERRPGARRPRHLPRIGGHTVRGAGWSGPPRCRPMQCLPGRAGP